MVRRLRPTGNLLDCAQPHMICRLCPVAVDQPFGEGRKPNT